MPFGKCNLVHVCPFQIQIQLARGCHRLIVGWPQETLLTTAQPARVAGPTGLSDGLRDHSGELLRYSV
jgi:hypothetical protein